MRLFDEQAGQPQRSGADWQNHREHRQPHTGPAQDEVGVLAMSSFRLARSNDVVISVRGITAYSDGLLLSVVVLFADEQRREDLDWSLQEYGRSPGRFRLGVVLPDGTRATNGTRDAPQVERPGTAAVLTLQTSSSGTLGWRGEYWLWPLPGSGSMIVGCQWPDRAIAESLVTVDSPPLLGAAATSRPVWEDG
jgi:hypothetical protein